GVGASSVVAIDPGVEGGESFVVGQPGLGVSELGQQGAVEPLGLAVGPGTAGLGEPAPDAQPGTYRPPVAPNPVDLGVVGQDPQDLHAVLLAEPGHRPVQKPRTGGVTLVGQRLDVGHARVVIDRDVQVVVADPAPTYVLAASVPAPAAAVGDPAQLFDIDVQQIPRSGAFVADPGVPAPDRFTGDRINRGKVRHLVASHDPPDPGGHQPEPACHVDRPAALLLAPGHHLGFHRRIGAGRRRVRPRGTIFQPGLAFGPVPADPLAHRWPKDPQLLGDARLRPTGQMTLHHQPAGIDRGAGVTVRHG